MEFFELSVGRMILSILILIVATYIVGLELKEKARLREKARQEDQSRIARDAENDKRRPLREEWLKKNPVIMYFKMIKGIKVVVRPEDYIRAQEQTTMMRLDKKWPNSHVLIPIRQSFVFVNSPGLDLLKANVGSLRKETYTERMNGWLSDLEKLVQSGMITLEERADLFVPWVDTNLLTIFQQTDMIDKACHPVELFTKMVLPRVPEHLRPL